MVSYPKLILDLLCILVEKNKKEIEAILSGSSQ